MTLEPETHYVICMSTRKEAYDACPPGWLYSFCINPGDTPRHAFLLKETLQPSIFQDFTPALGHWMDLDSLGSLLLKPEGVSKGLDRELLAPPPTDDFFFSVNVLNLVTKPAYRHVYNKTTGKFDTPEIDNRVFVVHIVGKLDTAYCERHQKILNSKNTLTGEVVGWAWVREDESYPGLPERFFERYERVLYSKHKRKPTTD